MNVQVGDIIKLENNKFVTVQIPVFLKNLVCQTIDRDLLLFMVVLSKSYAIIYCLISGRLAVAFQ